MSTVKNIGLPNNEQRHETKALLKKEIQIGDEIHIGDWIKSVKKGVPSGRCSYLNINTGICSIKPKRKDINFPMVYNKPFISSSNNEEYIVVR